MERIVVLSDTHMPRMAKRVPKKLEEYLNNADYIIHAGDWQDISLYEELSRYAKVYGVVGNVDGTELSNLLQSKLIIEISGFRIGITHGHGKRKTTEKRVLETFENEKLDLIIYGHSHIPIYKEINGQILFNPGSPTDKRRQKEYSFGLIEIENNIKLKHIFYSDKS